VIKGAVWGSGTIVPFTEIPVKTLWFRHGVNSSTARFLFDHPSLSGTK
jgi:hypothetical protein